VVVVVDDDRNMRESLRRLFTSAQVAVETFDSAALFLEQADLTRPTVLVLDVMMPSMTGLDLQRELKMRGVEMPVVFLTGSTQIPIAVEAMRQGAFDFLEKPFEPGQLLARVRAATESLTTRVPRAADPVQATSRLAILSQREREVLALVAQGKTSKEIARELGTSHRTVEIQRSRGMEKLGAKSLAHLVRIWLAATSGDFTS
jgi:FixJ family two-component response regulator